jgi:hypothetical protein
MKKLAPLGIVMGMIGYWGPWVHHGSVALILTGPDMGEFVKFLPAVRAGTEVVSRQLFYLPPFVAALALIFLAANKGLNYPPFLKVIVSLLVIPLALALLPPVFTPGLLLSAEFRVQCAALVLCLVLLVGQNLFRQLSLKTLAGLLILLTLTAIVPPVWQFLAIREALDRVYGQPVVLGWGLWVTGLGFLMVLAIGVAGWLRSR